MLDRKGQIGEIMTWVVATIIIVVILILFVYASSVLAQKTKVIKVKGLKIDFKKDVDLLETKIEIVYSLSSDENKEIIDAWREANE